MTHNLETMIFKTMTFKATTSVTCHGFPYNTQQFNNALSDTDADAYSETYFDALYEGTTDPWHYQTRWYEARKRNTCLSILLKPTYASAIELGCGNGIFSELLASRCDALLSIDGNHKAVDLARQHLSNLPHVKVMQGIIPSDLLRLSKAGTLSREKGNDDNARFDLIIISEILYYLPPHDIDTVITWVKEYLAVDGTLLCCHWRYPIDGFVMTGETVHQRLQHAFKSKQGVSNNGVSSNDLTLQHQTQMVDADFLLDVWQNSSKSVATQEGLV